MKKARQENGMDFNLSVSIFHFWNMVSLFLSWALLRNKKVNHFLLFVMYFFEKI